MIVCTSVSGSSAWYQEVLGLESAHGGDEYEMLMSGGELVLQLHELDHHHHPELAAPGEALGGNGVAIWFETDEFDDTVARIRSREPNVVADVHINPNAQHREIWLHDPDHYLVVVSSPYNDLG